MAKLGATDIYGDLRVTGKIKGTIYARDNTYNNALLCSNPDKTDDSAGDTWIYADSKGSPSNMHGIYHDQANDKLKFIGSNVDKIVFRLSDGAVTATSFIGALTGNATSASKVNSLLTRGTGLTGNNFDGSAATTWAVSYGTTAGTACQGNDSRLSDSRVASDVYAWAKATTKPTYTYSEVGAPSVTGVNASGTWGICITGNAATATKVNSLLTRGTGLTGNNFDGSAATTWAVSYGTTAGTACQGNDSRLSDSRVASDVYAWAKATTKPTYTYSEVGAPSVTGVNASGSWGINITGNAVTAGGLAVHSGTNNETNKIVRTDGNGYIQAGWINTISGDLGADAISRIYVSSDAYIRYVSPAQLISTLALVTTSDSRLTDSRTPLTHAHTTSEVTNLDTVLASKALLAGSSSQAFSCSTLTAATSIYSSGNITAYSDPRLKKIISKIENPIEKLNQLNGYSYERLDLNNKKEIGLLTSDVKKVLPELVCTLKVEKTELIPDGILETLDYSKITALLVEVCKSQQSEIDFLKQQLLN